MKANHARWADSVHRLEMSALSDASLKRLTHPRCLPIPYPNGSIRHTWVQSPVLGPDGGSFSRCLNDAGDRAFNKARPLP